MRFLKIILFHMLLMTTLFSCSGDESKIEFKKIKVVGAGVWEDKNEKTAEKTSIKKIEYSKGDVINFGVTPWMSQDQMQKAYAPILDFLTEKTNRKFVFVFNIAPDYRTLKKDLKQGNVQIASFSPGAYVDALDEMPDEIKYIATNTKVSGDKIRDFYHGYIFTLKKYKIKNLFKLKGKSFAFVDKGSSSGYKYPVSIFIKNKIDPESYFSNVFFLGSHDKVTDAVASGHVIAGATWDGNFEKAIKKYGNIFRIIKKTKPIPFDAWAAGKNVPDDFIKTLREILINIPQNAKTSKGINIFGKNSLPYTGFVKRNNDFYQVIRETSKLLKDYEKSKKQK